MPSRYMKKLRLQKLGPPKERNTTQGASWIRNDSNNTAAVTAISSDEEWETDEETANEKGEEFPHTAKSVLQMTPHFTYPALNYNGADNRKQQTQLYPTCKVGVPQPLYIAESTTPIVEPCALRVSELNEWTKGLNIHRCRYNVQTKHMKQREKKHQHNIYNCHVFNMAEHIAAQENAFFRDSHDFHYTGGNLEMMPNRMSSSSSSSTLLLHASGVNSQHLNFSELETNGSELITLQNLPLTNYSSELFQLLPMRGFRVNHGDMFLARFLNELVIYELKLNDDSDYELSCQIELSSRNGPTISAAQSEISDVILAIACQDRTVRFMDIIRNKDVSEHNVVFIKGVKQKCNTWAQIIARENSSFYYACQTVLMTIDMRHPNEVLTPCYASSMYSQQCETISCLAKSVNPNLIYVGSNHKLHCLDTRCMSKKIKDRAVVTWTHQMKFPPTFIDTCMYEGTEYVAMSSPLPSDQRICEIQGALAQNATDIFSPTMPYAPPSLAEALSNARLCGQVDVYADLSERIKTCTTGMKFQKHTEPNSENFARLLTANSIGDIYCQDLSVRDELNKQEEVRADMETNSIIYSYGERVKEKLKSKPLHCTNVHDMTVFREVFDLQRIIEEEDPPLKDMTIEGNFKELECLSDDSQRSEPTPERDLRDLKSSDEQPVNQNGRLANKPITERNRKKLDPLYRGPWQKSVYQLSKYEDILSPSLFSVWDIERDYDMSRDVHIEMVNKKLEQNQEYLPDLTKDWLDKLENIPSSPKLKPLFVGGTDLPTHYEAKNAKYIELAIDMENANQHNLSNIENSFGHRKQSKAKPKYQMGF